MSATLPISWLESNGWLVLSADADPLSEIRSLALGRCNASGAIAYVSFAADNGDALIDDMVELGAPSGYLIDLQDSDNNAIHEQLSRAGMIVIEAGNDIDRMKRLMTHTVAHALKEALEYGSLILLEGLASTLAGSCYIDGNGDICDALKFIQNSAILTGTGSIVDSESAQRILLTQAEMVCIAIERGAALVLGPEGHIETWGDNAVTFSLGSMSSEAIGKIEMRKTK